MLWWVIGATFPALWLWAFYREDRYEREPPWMLLAAGRNTRRVTSGAGQASSEARRREPAPFSRSGLDFNPDRPVVQDPRRLAHRAS